MSSPSQPTSMSHVRQPSLEDNTYAPIPGKTYLIVASETHKALTSWYGQAIVTSLLPNMGCPYWECVAIGHGRLAFRNVASGNFLSSHFADNYFITCDAPEPGQLQHIWIGPHASVAGSFAFYMRPGDRWQPLQTTEVEDMGRKTIVICAHFTATAWRFTDGLEFATSVQDTWEVEHG